MNVELREISKENKEEFREVCNAVDRSYLTDRLPHPYTQEDADWWVNMVSEHDGKDGLWRAIYADGKLVGTVSVEKRNDIFRKDGELGYFLLTEYWSKGIATKAARQICRLAFEKLDIIRISGNYFEPNIASGRVMEKVGFKHEGKKINAAVKGEKVYNLHLMGLLKEEFLG